MNFFIESIAIATPGMRDWNEAQKVLSQEKEFVYSPLDKYKPQLLPANERRRATEMSRLAFRVSEAATEDCAIPLKDLASVFSSSGGDYQIIDQICKVFTTDQRMVSPTQFHNSVHNSAAGYWGIATGSQMFSTSIAAYDYSCSAGLIEAALYLDSNEGSVLLTVYDAKPPSPLSDKRKIDSEFGMAFILSSKKTLGSLLEVNIKLTNDNKPVSIMENQTLELLRLSNPAARSLPLLEAIVKKYKGTLVFDIQGDQQLELLLT